MEDNDMVALATIMALSLPSWLKVGARVYLSGKDYQLVREGYGIFSPGMNTDHIFAYVKEINLFQDYPVLLNVPFGREDSPCIRMKPHDLRYRW